MYKRNFKFTPKKQIQSNDTARTKRTVNESDVALSSKSFSSPSPFKRAKTVAAEEVLNTSNISLPNASDENNFRRSRTSTQILKENFFLKVITESGYIFCDGDYNVLNVKKGAFLSNVEQNLCAESKNVGKFMKGLQEYCKDVNNFKRALECPKFSTDICPDDESFHLRPDSLFHMLLTVKDLQPEMIVFLMEKALQLYLLRTRSKKDDTPWVYLILKQLRFMGPIVDAKALIELYFITLKDVDNIVQIDVIAMFPDIFGTEHHEDCARKFQSMIRQNHSLIPALLDVLSQLEVSSELQDELNRETLKILPQVPLKYLPAVISFLVVSLPTEELQEVVSAIRDYPNYLRLGSQNSQKEGDVENYRVLTIEALYCALMTNKALVKIWMKTLEDIVEVKFFKSIDVIVLILLCSVDNDEHKKLAQKIFKGKIKTGIITSELLVKVFQHYAKVVEQYLTSILSLMSKFLLSADTEIINHAVSWFRLCLESLDSGSCYSVASLLLREVLEGRPTSSKACLMLLNEIAVSDVSKLDQHYNLIMMRLLPRVADHDLLEVRQMMEFICRLVYSEFGHRRDLDNELSRYLQKLQSSWCSEMKLKGVLCNVIAAKSIAVDSSTSDYGPSKTMNIGEENDELEMSGRALKAKSTIEMVTDGNPLCPKAEALLYEELATTIKLVPAADIDKSFVAWLFQTVQDDFGANYVMEFDGMSLPNNVKLQYLLNEYSSPGSAICIDIASALQKEMQPGYITSRYSMLVLCPMVRLLCTLSLLDSGNLVAVDALLGCEITYPTSDMDDDFVTLDSSDQKFFLDCLFYSVNWFIELVNGFSGQDVHDVKVCQRIGHIIAVLKRLAERVMLLPEYRPPDCSFYHEVMVKPVPATKGRKPATDSKKNKKKSKKGNVLQGTPRNLTQNPGTQAATQAMKARPGKELTWWAIMSQYRPFFREIDLNVFIMLRKPLNVQSDSQEVVDEAELNCESLLFLLVDFVAKLEYMLPAHVKKVIFGRSATNRDAGFVRMWGLSARKFAHFAIKNLDHLCIKLKQVFGSLKALLDKCAGVYDAQPMFTPHSIQLKCCCDYLLRAMIAIFSWESFHAGGNDVLLTDALRVLVKQTGDHKSSQAASLKKLVRESCSYLKSFETLVLDIHSASSLVKLLQTLILFIGNDDKLMEDVASMCHGYLKQTWFSSLGVEEEGAEHNRVIATFVGIYFNSSLDTFDMVTQLIDNIESEAGALKKGDSLTCMCSVNRKNVHVLLQEGFRTLISATENKLKATTSSREKMDVWKKVNTSLQQLISILKRLLSRHNKVAFFKNCAAMVKLYITQAVPVWEEMFRAHRNEVLADINGMQCFTRFLYPMCNQAKQERDSVLMNYGPDVKQSLTKLMFTMRGILAFNSSSDAFWTGVLKNKDLTGRPVVSSTDSQEMEDDDNEDVTEEDGNEGQESAGENDEQLVDDESSDADLDANENEGSDEDARVSTEF